MSDERLTDSRLWQCLECHTNNWIIEPDDADDDYFLNHVFSDEFTCDSCGASKPYASLPCPDCGYKKGL